MKKDKTMKARGFRIEDHQYAHLQKKAGKNGTPSAEVRDLIDADITTTKEKKK